MVWVVSGCRLDRDRKLGERLKSLPTVISIADGVQYSELYIDSDSSWFDSEKFVFFDFEGGFDNPELAGNLYCLLPGFYGGSRLGATISKADFVKALVSGDEKEFLEAIGR